MSLLSASRKTALQDVHISNIQFVLNSLFMIPSIVKGRGIQKVLQFFDKGSINSKARAAEKSLI